MRSPFLYVIIAALCAMSFARAAPGAIVSPSNEVIAAKSTSACDIFAVLTTTIRVPPRTILSTLAKTTKPLTKFDHPSPTPTTLPAPIPNGYGKYGWSGWSFSSTDDSLVNPVSGEFVAATTLATSASVSLLNEDGIYSMGIERFWFGCSTRVPDSDIYFANSCNVMLVVTNDDVDGGSEWLSYGPFGFGGYEGGGAPPDYGGYNMTEVRLARAYGMVVYFVVTYSAFGRNTLYVDNMVLSRPDPKCI